MLRGRSSRRRSSHGERGVALTALVDASVLKRLAAREVHGVVERMAIAGPLATPSAN